MTETHSRRVGFELLATAALVFALAVEVSAQGEDGTPPLQFVAVWFGGALDSIYSAEYQRLSSECSELGDACWVERLDSTAVPIVPVWAEPGAAEPVGRLVARLRTDDRWPHAALLFQGTDGREVTLLAEMGDWGYRSILAIRDWRDGLFQPWLLEPVGDYWIGESEEGYGLIADPPFGLAENLWRFGPLRAGREPRRVHRAALPLLTRGGRTHRRPTTTSPLAFPTPTSYCEVVEIEASGAEARLQGG